jgi:hypothetical protein
VTLLVCPRVSRLVRSQKPEANTYREWRPVERPRPATINKADFLRQIAAFVQVHEPRFCRPQTQCKALGFCC